MSCSARSQPLEHVGRRREQPLAGRRQHQALADAQEQRGAEARLDVAQLVAERRLGQVQLIAGAGQAADVGDGGDEPEVANLEIHEHEATSSS